MGIVAIRMLKEGRNHVLDLEIYFSQAWLFRDK